MEHMSEAKTVAKSILVFIAAIMLVLSGLIPHIIVQPASAVTPTPSPFNTLFGPSIYKILVHVNGADKGDISPYYHRYLAGYKENGYDQVLYNMDHNLLAITGEAPYNGGFETMKAWINESTPSIAGQYLVEQSSTKYVGGSKSLHAKANVSDGSFGYTGIFQDMLWQISPVASDLNLRFSIYPVSLQNTTIYPDSLIVLQLDYNHYDSATTVPKMFLVLQDNPSEALSAGTTFVNSTDNVYITLNKQTALSFNAWNNFNLNITDLAIRYYGQIMAYNLKIDGFHISAYSRNNATSEYYIDTVKLTSTDTPEQTYSKLSNVVEYYNTPDLRMVPGEKLDLPTALLYFNINTYFSPSGYSINNTRKTMGDIHSRGDYVFISKPDGNDNYRNNAVNNLWPVDGMSIFSTHNKRNYGFSMDIWDYYLTKGVLTMAIAEQHPLNAKDVQVSATTAPTQFVYASDNSPATTIEAMAQGRGFIEAGYVRPMMPLFFSAEDNQVAAGKFPIYVDSSRSKASLNINLQNIPFVAKNLRIIRNGTTINTVSLKGLTSYDNTFIADIPDKSNYFRFEVVNANGTIIAFSNPILYVKTSIRSDMWLALSPSLQYGSATSSIDSIIYGNDKLNFTAKSRETIPITTKVFTTDTPEAVLGAESWIYDSTLKILSVITKGTARVTVSFTQNTTTSTTTNTTPTTTTVTNTTITTTTTTVTTITTTTTTTTQPPPSNSLLTLSFQGYDYNNQGEVSILVNDQVAATLPTSYSPQNKAVYVNVTLDISKYILSGTNTITFLENIYSTGVRNVLVTNNTNVVYSNSTYYSLWIGGRESVTYRFNLLSVSTTTTTTVTTSTATTTTTTTTTATPHNLSVSIADLPPTQPTSIFFNGVKNASLNGRQTRTWIFNSGTSLNVRTSVTLQVSEKTYTFDHWTLDGVNQSSIETASLLMNQNHSIVAHYAVINTLILNTNNLNQKVFNSSDTVRVGASITNGTAITVNKITVSTLGPAGYAGISNVPMKSSMNPLFNYAYDYEIRNLPAGTYKTLVSVTFSNNRTVTAWNWFKTIAVTIVNNESATASAGSTITMSFNITSAGSEAQNSSLYIDLPNWATATSVTLDGSAWYVVKTTGAPTGYTRYYVPSMWVLEGKTRTVKFTVNVAPSAPIGTYNINYFLNWKTWEGHLYSTTKYTCGLTIV